MKDTGNAIGVFRYCILSPLLDPDLKRGEKTELLNRISRTPHKHPNTEEFVLYKPETIRHWLKQYRKQGFQGLIPKGKPNKGQSKSIPDQIAEDAINLKLEQPRRTLDGIIRILETAGKIQKGEIKRSSLHRLFQARNISARFHKKSKAFIRFEALHSNDLWQSDMMFGPWFPDPDRPGRKYQPVLTAFIDDHSRLITHGQFYRYQNLDTLVDVLKKAIQKRGVPVKIYVDNGKVYRSRHLASICAHLGIQLKFTEVYAPESKGKIEKFFSFVRSNFLPEVEAGNILDLNRLNQAFEAWLAVHYHHKIHSSTKESPNQRFIRHKDRIRRPNPDTFRQAFLYKEERTVKKDCTFVIKGITFEVNAHLVKQKILILYDPYDLSEARVLLDGRFHQIAKPMKIQPTPQLKRESKSIESVNSKVTTSYNQAARLIEAHKTQADQILFGPELPVTPNEIKASDFISFIEKSRALDTDEKTRVRKFFKDNQPVVNPAGLKILDHYSSRYGFDRHIDQYLELFGKVHS